MIRATDGVDPVRRHLGEVAMQNRRIVVFIATGIGPERPVRHAADVELFVTDEQELAARLWPQATRDGTTWLLRSGCAVLKLPCKALEVLR